MAESLQIVRGLLRTVRMAWCLSRLVTGVVSVCAALSCVVLFTCLLDNAVALPTAARWGGLGIWIATGIAAAWRWIIAPSPLLATEERLAAHFETLAPEVDNALINTVQLAAAEGPSPANWMVQQYIVESVGSLRAFSGWEAFEKAQFIAALKRAAVAIACLVLYAVLFPNASSSALYRVTHPASTMNAAFGMRVEVSPGDVTIPEGGDVHVAAIVSGPVPESVVIEYEEADAESSDAGDPIRVAMHPVDEAYKAILRNVVTSRKYRVVAAPSAARQSLLGFRSVAGRTAVSKTYRIDTVPPPRLERLRIESLFPSYLGREAEVDDPGTGDLKMPVGTQVTMSGEASKPLASARMVFGEEAFEADIDGGNFTLAFTVEKSISYQFALEDDQGFSNVNDVYHTITAVPDKAPSVSIVSPEGDVSVGAADLVPIVFRAEDDYGLTRVELCVAQGQDTEPKVLHGYLDGTKALREFEKAVDVPLEPMNLEAGEVVQLWVRAVDNLPEDPNQRRSRTVNVRIAGGTADDPNSEAAQSILARVAALAAAQSELNKSLNRPLKRHVGEEEAASLYRDRLSEGAVRQEGIREEAIAVATEAGAYHSGEVGRVLGGLAANEMPRVVEQLRGLGRESAQPDAGTAAEALKLQSVIAAKLEDLLKRLEGQAQSEEAGMELEELEQELEQEDVREQIEETLTEFTYAQREIIEQSNNLSAKPVDDLTAEEKDAFKAAAVAEDELSEFLEELLSDLSELPEQDFSIPSLKEELVEILAEVELAEDALELENKTIAVSAEETGLELAEELIHDLPRWLSDVPDVLKWDMEEPPEEYDTPMAELPEELYDMMGELIDEEAAMTEEVEDESSSWADSIDAGAGWMAMDGPISNMSAKGITGNLLPNSSEIGGRSGEGRTGRAHGEFVEQTAQGKGGRDTPTRITPDAYEQGVVEDSNTDPVGGATGGGKLSGAGGSGLPGPPPPELQNTMKRLAGRQADIRARAERLQFKLEVVNIPAPGLDEAIGSMREIEEDLRSYRYESIVPKKEILLNTMRESRQNLQQQIKVRGEQPVFLPKPDQLEILEALDEEVVPEYRDMVAEYFKALSQAR